MTFQSDSRDFEKRSGGPPGERPWSNAQRLKLARYRAPALERGLEVLELLAHSRTPLSLSEIGRCIKRRASEIFRIMHLLDARGFVRRSTQTGAYVISDQVLALATASPRLTPLVDAARPIMGDLAFHTRQACFLCVATGTDAVVVACQPRPDNAGFSIALGYRAPLGKTAAGHVLLAFRSRPPASVPGPRQIVEGRARARLEEIRAKGLLVRASPILGGIVDVSAPILRHGHAIAALTVPYAEFETGQPQMKTVIDCLRTAARHIADTCIGDEN